ncbi:AsmA family protein [Marinimicrobium locisalis]|uniref:AsmA family protein n=1 Tax=Marinimicrobium locisalis TaxID=546022 RepID=UPI00322152EE
MKFLRRLIKVLVALVLLVVIAAVALVFVFDPNMFKPRLEAMAREQGIALNIDGNLGWQLWPALGVEVNDIRVAAVSAPEQTIAALDQASLRLAIRPLLSGDVSVHHVLVDGAAFDLQVDESGKGNWEQLLPAESDAPASSEADPQEAPASTQPPSQTSSDSADTARMELAVEQITLADASLRYRDAVRGQDFSLEPLNLNVEGFNLQGNPFDVDLGWEASVEDRELFGSDPLQMLGELAAQVTLAEDFSRLVLVDGKLRLDFARAGASDDIRLTVSATVEQLMTNPSFTAELNLQPFSPKALMAVLSLPEPEMAGAEALTRVALNATVEGSAERITVDPLRLELDDTTIEGRAAVTDLSSGAIDVALTGDRINIDHYLPPPVEEEATVDSESPEGPGSSGDEPIIPLDAIRELDVAFGLDFGSLTAMGLSMSDLSLRLLAEEGVVNLERAQLQAYEGRLDAGGQLDATGDTALIDLVADLSGLSLGPLLSDLELDEEVQLSGALNADVSAETRGVTMSQLTEALNAEAAFSGAEVRLAPLNVERKFCEIVSRVTDSNAVAQKEWADYTELTALSGRLAVDGPVFTLESLQAGVERLTVGAQGTLNLKESRYDFTLPLRLGSESTSEGGCRVSSNYWLDRSLSLLRCRGDLESLNPVSDCRPDASGLKSLVKDFAAYKLKEQHGESIQAEKARAEQKIEEEKARAKEKLEEEKRELEEKVREKLRGSKESETAEQGDDEENAEPSSAEERLKDLFRR